MKCAVNNTESITYSKAPTIPTLFSPCLGTKIVNKKISNKISIYKGLYVCVRACVRARAAATGRFIAVDFSAMCATMLNAHAETTNATSGRKGYHLGVRLDDGLRAALRSAATEERRTPSDLARIMIADALAARLSSHTDGGRAG